jgi:hypothetical protein
MGMYLKQQQANTELHKRLTSQLEKRLQSPKAATVAVHSNEAQETVVSFRMVWFIVLVTGGVVAILLAFLQRQHPDSVTTSLGARSLGYLGLTSILAGCLSLVLRRHRGHHHA